MIVDTIGRKQAGPATALDAGEPLVTRDREHFGRVAGLTVAGY